MSAERILRRFLAETKTLDLAWVEGLRKDFLTLMKNIPRVEDYKTAHRLREAFTIYRNRFEELFFKEFLNKALKYDYERLGITESDAKYIDKRLRSVVWDLQSELRVPIRFADEYWPEGACIAEFKKDSDKWEARLRRKAQIAWREIKEMLEWMARTSHKSVTVHTPDEEQLVLEGFRVTVINYNPDDEQDARSMAVFKEGLNIYRKNATERFPLLLKKQCPLKLSFIVNMENAGVYESSERVIAFYASGLISEGPLRAAHILAHEMGHHIWHTYLGEDAKKFWEQTLSGDYGDLDVAELLQKWPGDAWVMDLPKVLADTDPILALQIDAVSHEPDRRNRDRLDKKEDFEKLLASGTKTIQVPKHPITGYANKNYQEAFCETIGLLVGYGPRTLDERVKLWLRTMLPGEVKTARQNVRVSV